LISTCSARFPEIFPPALRHILPRVDPVFGMYVKLMLGLGLTFQLPVLMFVLARLGIVTAGFLIKNFKYAVLLMFIFAAVITPDGNPVNQVMVGGPMVGLYIIGIAAAWLFGKSKKPDVDE
jgi:sec-independent protein translocase protein TatC